MQTPIPENAGADVYASVSIAQAIFTGSVEGLWVDCIDQLQPNLQFYFSNFQERGFLHIRLYTHSYCTDPHLIASQRKL